MGDLAFTKLPRIDHFCLGSPLPAALLRHAAFIPYIRPLLESQKYDLTEPIVLAQLKPHSLSRFQPLHHHHAGSSALILKRVSQKRGRQVTPLTE